VDIIVDSLQQDETVHQKRLIDFFKKIEIAGAGPSFVAKLHNAGYDNIKKVLHMTLQDFYNVLGQSSKTAEKIHSQLQKKLLKLTVPELLNASNILDRGFGLTRLEMIFESYPDLFSYDERSMYSLLMGLTGISSTLAELFVSKSSVMKEFLSTINKIREKIDIKIQYKQEFEQQQKQAKTISSIYSGVTFVFTGKRNKELETWLVSNGATIGKTVTSKTSFVVTDKIESNSSKIIKANSMNIPVITMEDLLKDAVK
jgi:NAD-dependent DNA ligase